MGNCKALLVVTLLCGSLPVQADTLFGLYAGVDSWQSSLGGSFANRSQQQDFSFKTKNQLDYYLAIEHFLPFLPNLRLQRGSLTSKGFTTLEQSFDFAGQSYVIGSNLDAELALNTSDFILYYQLFDNVLFHLNLGVNAKKLTGDVSVASEQRIAAQRVEQWLPMLYTDGKLSLFGTGIDVFASAHLTSIKRSNIYDIQAGFGYHLVNNMFLDARFKLGYRAVDMRLDNLDNLYADLTFQGIFAGVEVHF